MLLVRNELIRKILDEEILAEFFGNHEIDQRGIRVKVTEVARMFGLEPDYVRQLIREARALREQIAIEASECA